MSTPMTKAAAARIQSATAIANGGMIPKGSFAAKAASAAAKNAISNATPQNWPSKVPDKDSGRGRDNNPPKKSSKGPSNMPNSTRQGQSGSMRAGSKPSPVNGPSKTGNPSGGGRGNNPPAPAKR